MSKNNVIIVVRDQRRGNPWFYVLDNLNADTQWSKQFAKSKIRKGNLKRTKCRATALILAHNLQKKHKTEYGVWELSLF